MKSPTLSMMMVIMSLLASSLVLGQDETSVILQVNSNFEITGVSPYFLGAEFSSVGVTLEGVDDCINYNDEITYTIDSDTPNTLVVNGDCSVTPIDVSGLDSIEFIDSTNGPFTDTVDLYDVADFEQTFINEDDCYFVGEEIELSSIDLPSFPKVETLTFVASNGVDGDVEIVLNDDEASDPLEDYVVRSGDSISFKFDDVATIDINIKVLEGLPVIDDAIKFNVETSLTVAGISTCIPETYSVTCGDFDDFELTEDDFKILINDHYESIDTLTCQLNRGSDPVPGVTSASSFEGVKKVVLTFTNNEIEEGEPLVLESVCLTNEEDEDLFYCDHSFSGDYTLELDDGDSNVVSDATYDSVDLEFFTENPLDAGEYTVTSFSSSELTFDDDTLFSIKGAASITVNEDTGSPGDDVTSVVLTIEVEENDIGDNVPAGTEITINSTVEPENIEGITVEATVVGETDRVVLGDTYTLEKAGEYEVCVYLDEEKIEGDGLDHCISFTVTPGDATDFLILVSLDGEAVADDDFYLEESEDTISLTVEMEIKDEFDNIINDGYTITGVEEDDAYAAGEYTFCIVDDADNADNGQGCRTITVHPFEVDETLESDYDTDTIVTADSIIPSGGVDINADVTLSIDENVALTYTGEPLTEGLFHGDGNLNIDSTGLSLLIIVDETLFDEEDNTLEYTVAKEGRFSGAFENVSGQTSGSSGTCNIEATSSSDTDYVVTLSIECTPDDGEEVELDPVYDSDSEITGEADIPASGVDIESGVTLTITSATLGVKALPTGQLFSGEGTLDIGSGSRLSFTLDEDDISSSGTPVTVASSGQYEGSFSSVNVQLRTPPSTLQEDECEGQAYAEQTFGEGEDYVVTLHLGCEPSDADEGDDDGLSGGAIAGIVIACVLAALILCVAVYLIVKKCSGSKGSSAPTQSRQMNEVHAANDDYGHDEDDDDDDDEDEEDSEYESEYDSEYDEEYDEEYDSEEYTEDDDDEEDSEEESSEEESSEEESSEESSEDEESSEGESSYDESSYDESSYDESSYDESS